MQWRVILIIYNTTLLHVNILLHTMVCRNVSDKIYGRLEGGVLRCALLEQRIRLHYHLFLNYRA